MALVAAACLALSGCQTRTVYVPEAPTKAEDIVFDPDKGVILMPLTKGNQWTFELAIEHYTDGKQDPSPPPQEVTYRVVDANKRGDDTYAYLVMTTGDTIEDKQHWLVSKDGMYQLSESSRDIAYTPPQLIIRFPVRANGTFEWVGQGFRPDGSVGDQTNRSKVLAVEQVDTSMGPFKAIPIETHSDFSGNKSINTTWFHPGLGIVRFWQQVDVGKDRTVLVLKLKNYALKQS